MEILSEKIEMGVVEQRFELPVDSEAVPGIRWHPEGAKVPRPTILIGHGGTQHKRVPNVLGLARRFVRHLGYSAVALDAPGHGERIREWVERTARGMAEWRALLDRLDEEGHGPRYGYWGVSMGTAIGLPFVAAEPRIGAAVLGLAGLGNRPGAERFELAARGLTIPILLVLQWNDELVGQTSGLALFDAIGSTEKTLHINPGGHVQIPLFERDAYESFFVRHLGSARTAA